MAATRVSGESVSGKSEKAAQENKKNLPGEVKAGLTARNGIDKVTDSHLDGNDDWWSA